MPDLGILQHNRQPPEPDIIRTGHCPGNRGIVVRRGLHGDVSPGPVMKNGYTDAAANLVPVLPPTYRRGDLVAKPKKKSDKNKQQQLPSGMYQNVMIEDAMSRDMPAGNQGLVFSSVVFSA